MVVKIQKLEKIEENAWMSNATYADLSSVKGVLDDDGISICRCYNWYRCYTFFR